MDRNSKINARGSEKVKSLSARRAWIEINMLCSVEKCWASLSARRAWIEMLASRLVDMSAAVALRKESVDRNTKKSVSYSAVRLSLSARRAWIEIL